VRVSFDLALSAAVLLLAGRISPAELDPAFLGPHRDALLRLASRIEVCHAPELTAAVIESARAVPAARSTLSSLGPLDLVQVARRYRQSHGAGLLTAREAIQIGRAMLGPSCRRGRAARSGAPVALSFPSRVTIRMRDGRSRTVRIDVPPGTFCSPSGPRELEAKVIRELTPGLGGDRARTALEAGLRIEQEGLAGFVASVTLPPTGP
jgi:2-methylcitrate dehydratase PrpD